MVKPETAQKVPTRTGGDAAELKAEIAAALKATRLKSELVATVSHELRTPLTSVLGFTELLLHRDLDEETRRRYLRTIHDEAQRLRDLIDDFLDLEKIEAGRFTLALESVELSELLQHEVQLFSAQSTSHALDLKALEEPLAIVGDRARIAQVIANLLSNAIKYSPAGGAVTITAMSHEGFGRVEVRDSGLGIPADQQAAVFTKFFRADSSDTRTIGGTGLGLALCREIVTAHGGRIGFESSEGVGSTFWFELPSTRHVNGTGARARVLVIEDDPELATALAELLALDGLAVEVSATGEAGLERAFALPPALICLDLDQPGELDCWQVLARLKTNTTSSHVPVIVCTGEQGRGTASILGATAFVPQPITAEHLREAVARELAAERSSVLVVGSDVALRRLIVETLARDGGELREAADGLEALAMIAAQHPDVLVMDLPDTDADSFDAIERLLDLPETQGLPIIVLAGRDLSASERRFLSERSASLVEKREYSGEQLRRLVHRSPSSVRLRAVDIPFAAKSPTSATETRHHAR